MSFNNIIFILFLLFFLLSNVIQTIEHQTAAKIQWTARRSLKKREKVSDDVSNDFDNIADKSSVSMLLLQQ